MRSSMPQPIEPRRRPSSTRLEERCEDLNRKTGPRPCAGVRRWLGGSRLWGGATDRLGQSLDDPGEALVRANRETVGEDWGELLDLLPCDVVPNGQNEVAAGVLAGHEAVQLVLRLSLAEKMRAEDGDSEPGLAQAVVDGLAQTVADLQRELVVPHAQTGGSKALGQGGLTGSSLSSLAWLMKTSQS